MLKNSAHDLQNAIFSALANHAGVVSELGGPRIYDDVPQRSHYPYITFGDIQTRNWDTQTSHGHEHIVTLHVWSDHRGRKQVNAIIGEIDAALDGQELTLSNHSLVNLHITFWSAMRDLDGEKYHGLVRMRAVTETLLAKRRLTWPQKRVAISC